ncbi:23S rRNA (guanine(745)-N(1))-methyltransferase [Pseudoalteromonas sp. BDTF-M6]|uniref:23S rRNA (guanine(745)-N(1))-methyltransferase n=1 Tax=Pseudoalteromonas sp. BDTF-M6 TaxID=2796132 RepID=UPI001BAEF1B5|nr:23S rRNA (guanine(745)-N(1))-methyltransferase [Pseudoalteromonas sp. BDTF-M6]MBS3796922.1 23S rRNA (guanine(745)-N(1))-methyltransferase [Pseudoalteromonas sp. BDTF-M6]
MSAYRCPLCQQPLARQGNGLSCEQGHQFDYAKEGYINLLPVQYKKSKQPGDNQDMVQARRRFLSAGHYQFLRQALAERVSALHQANTAVIDMGCGEGYYTSELANQLQHKGQVYGIDIAKPAVRYAAKRYDTCEFAVASSKQIPLKAGSASVVTSVFAPIFAQESARLLAPQGHLVVASPGPRHLAELKEIIYREVREHQQVDIPTGFTRSAEQLLSHTLTLTGEQARDLALMTPFAWKFSVEQLAALEAQPEFKVQAEFYLSEFQKSS